ncbi:PREDICTED: uncharacterized protein LOC101300543 [Fragaria vesca subsp. vesca]
MTWRQASRLLQQWLIIKLKTNLCTVVLVPVVVQTNLEKGRTEAKVCFKTILLNVLFFSDEEFRVRYRMSHKVFNRIRDGLCNYDRYFIQKSDAIKKVSLLPEQKMTSSLRMLAYGAAADQCAEYWRMAKFTSIECLQRFTRGIVALYSAKYLRAPTLADLKRLLAKGERRGFPRMIGSIDCMRWQ